MRVYKYIFLFLVTLQTGCIAIPDIPADPYADPHVDENDIAYLKDLPAVKFSTYGYSFTDTPNPFILTADYLNNSMIMVSRLKVGEIILKGDTKVPQDLSLIAIKKAIEKRLKNEDELRLFIKKMNGYDVVVANYRKKERIGVELAFEFKGYLLHILLLAKEGNYFNHATHVVSNIVNTLQPIE